MDVSLGRAKHLKCSLLRTGLVEQDEPLLSIHQRAGDPTTLALSLRVALPTHLAKYGRMCICRLVPIVNRGSVYLPYLNHSFRIERSLQCCMAVVPYHRLT